MRCDGQRHDRSQHYGDECGCKPVTHVCLRVRSG
jgi:hypothetical protein